MADPRNYYARETLKDGTAVSIRAIRKDDKESLHNAFRALDREAVYQRFFAPKQDLTDLELEQVIDVDFSQVVALVATVSRADGEEIEGLINSPCLRHDENGKELTEQEVYDSLLVRVNGQVWARRVDS